MADGACNVKRFTHFLSYTTKFTPTTYQQHLIC